MAARKQAKSDAAFLPTHRAFRPYVAALGQLALAWNGLHETLCLLFCSVVGKGPINQPAAIWHALKVDRAQREILVAAAENHILGAYPVGYPEDIKWLCQRIDALEDLRNDALHSPAWGYERSPGEIIIMPNINLGHVRANKLFKKDALSEFRWCRDSAIELSKFAWEMDRSLCDYMQPWPDRPSLPTHQGTNEPKPRPQGSKAKRLRQRQSSRA